jgi:hypothetical protein
VFKGMSKKRHTRAPYENHTLEGMVKKRHPYAHAYHQGYLCGFKERPGVIFKELQWYKNLINRTIMVVVCVWYPVLVMYLFTRETTPQTDELSIVIFHLLNRSDAGYWMLDAG